MTAWIVIPVKAPGDGKSRLGAVLDDAGRRDLVASMLAAAVAAASAIADSNVLLLGPARHGLPDTLRRLDDPGTGLNPALASATRAATAAGVDRLVFVSADLPRVTRADIEALLAIDADRIGIAPDRAGTGTNALSLPLPAAADFRFAYGDDSFARHRAEAARLGLSVAPVRSPGLAFDIDRPEDLAELRG
jgi:2-phospho-L-lactate guanylyltransferase